MNLIPTFYDEQNKIWSGARKEPFYHPDCSIGKIIFQILKSHPNNVLQISDTEDTTMTNLEALTAAKRMAQHFKEMDLGHDDVIGIVAFNTTYVMPLVVACLFNCTPFHAVNSIYDEKTLSYIFGLTKPKLIFCDAEFYEKIQLATQSFKPVIYTLLDRIEGVPCVFDLLEPTKTELKFSPQPLTLGEEQTVAILCSSGTTGLPKAVCISNSRLLRKAYMNSLDVIHSGNGIHWSSGLYFLIFNCLSGCKRIISNRLFSAEYFVEIVQKYQVTIASFAPHQVNVLVKCPTATPQSLSSLKYILFGGNCIASATILGLRKKAAKAVICFTYGSTEMGTMSLNYGVNNPTSAGKLLQGVRMRIVDESGQNLGPMELGELYVDHEHAWNGYYNDSKASQVSRDSEGWFHTGDLGYFDADNYLYVVDYKKDILKFKGIQFWSSEIEDCIMEMPQVDAVAVVGIYDEGCGHKAGALVVKSKGSTLSAQDIENQVAKKMILEHKQLHAGVIFVESLPRNLNGKILKTKVKEIFLTQKQGAGFTV